MPLYGWIFVMILFSCLLLIHIVQALVTKLPDIIRTIISWTVDYLQDHVINWIREQGGWVNVPLLICQFSTDTAR